MEEGQVSGGAKPFVPPPGRCLNVLHIFEPLPVQPAHMPVSGPCCPASSSHVLQHLCSEDGMDVESGEKEEEVMRSVRRYVQPGT